jgi:hypothetical protein
MKTALLAAALMFWALPASPDEPRDRVIANINRTDWVVIANGDLRDPVFVRDGRTVWIVHWENGTKTRCPE